MGPVSQVQYLGGVGFAVTILKKWYSYQVLSTVLTGCLGLLGDALRLVPVLFLPGPLQDPLQTVLSLLGLPLKSSVPV